MPLSSSEPITQFTHDLSPQHCYAAMQARDVRFDGVFFVGVLSTGIYCRPVCKVRIPKAENCRYYANHAAAEAAGFRPCLKCRPELAPGNSKNDAAQRLAHLAAEKIQVENNSSEQSLEQLAAQFQISSRQLRRVIKSEFGVSPIALAQTHRLLLAKQLLMDTALPITDIAFASGFNSVRRFNAAFLKHYRLNPSSLRKQSTQIHEYRFSKRSTLTSIDETPLVLQLGYRPPFDWQGTIQFLTSRGNSLIESVVDDHYWRVLSIGNHTGWICVANNPVKNTLLVKIAPSLITHLTKIKILVRQLFDLDANPSLINKVLSRDDLLRPLIRTNPGLRVPGCVDGFELTLRAVLGQQVSVKAASTLFGRFVERFGEMVSEPPPIFTDEHSIVLCQKTSPKAAAIARSRLQTLINLGLTQKRAQTIHTLAKATVKGDLNWQMNNVAELEQQLLAIPGVGPWTVSYVGMRAFNNPNAFPESDLGLMNALQLKKPKDILKRAEDWQPWRAYAAMHLWRSLNSGG